MTASDEATETRGSAGGMAAEFAEDLREHYDRSDGSLHQDRAPARPSMVFALPPAQPRSEGGPEPSQTATEGDHGVPPEGSRAAAPSPLQADARAVAERVYELMRQEIVLARLRGAGR